jgi:hypothetical protein
MRRIQIHLEDELDRAAAEEAAREGISKAALIRRSVARELDQLRGQEPQLDLWEELIGCLDNEPVKDIDEFLYGPVSPER